MSLGIYLIYRRVRDHSRFNPRRLRYAWIPRWSTTNRQSVPLERLHQYVWLCTSGIWRLPIPSFWLRRHGSALPIALFPKIQDILLVLRGHSVVGDNVPITPLPHRFDRRSVPFRRHLLHHHARQIQGH